MRARYGDHGHRDGYGGEYGYGDGAARGGGRYGGSVPPRAGLTPRQGGRGPASGSGGIPDGLLVGLLAFLLGVTVLVWSATGLAGLLAHGSWPTGVTFSHTPLALRHLIGHPHDVAGAWPHTPRGQLSGYGLLWGLFIGQLMVLFVLAVFAIGTVTRWRAHRAVRRAELGRARYRGRAAGAGPAAVAGGPLSLAKEDVPLPGRVPASGPGAVPASGGRTVPGAGASEAGDASASEAGAPGSRSTSGTAGIAPSTSGSPSASGSPSDSASGPVSGSGLGSASGGPAGPAGGAQAGDVAARLVLGLPDVRRPLAVQAVRDAEGPVLVVTSDPVVWAETKDSRAKLGPVLLYDPAHRCETPARLHWSPSAGCEDRAVAAERARALLAPVRPTAKIDTAVADTAETLLRSFLHAAAVDGRPFRQVHRWAQGSQVQDAVRILRSHPKATSGTAGELEAALTSHPERRDIAQELTARALSALSSVHIRDVCTPNRNDTAGLDSFVNEGGTLYVVGEPIEDPKARPGAMPLLTALASDVVEHGRRMAERSSSGRLDPPLTLVLDDVAAVAPLPRLPDLLARGADHGMPTLVLLRSREQARARWPHNELPS